MNTPVIRRCVCQATTGLRPYPAGWRCANCTPAKLAGEIEPDEVAAIARRIREQATPTADRRAA